jgi:hypothetical protein
VCSSQRTMERWLVCLLPIRCLSSSFMECLAMSTSLVGTGSNEDEDDLVGKSSCLQVDVAEHVSKNHGLFGCI